MIRMPLAQMGYPRSLNAVITRRLPRSGWDYRQVISIPIITCTTGLTWYWLIKIHKSSIRRSKGGACGMCMQKRIQMLLNNAHEPAARFGSTLRGELFRSEYEHVQPR